MTNSFPTVPESPCGMGPSDLDAGLGAEPSAAALPPLAQFVADIAASDWENEDMNYLVVSTLYAQGSTARQVRRDGASAIRTLQAIISKARELVADAPEEASPRQVSQPIRETK